MFYIITKDDCHWCDKAKHLIEQNGGAFRPFPIEDSPVVRLLLLKAGLNTVPQIWKDKEYIGGYTDLVNWMHNGKT